MRTNLKKVQWCPKCGDFMILIAINKALKELDIPKHKVVFVSGIWCSGKMTHYLDGYAAETLHGRVVPFATGVKLANPDLTVIWIWWDGDGYGIWLSHFLNGARRNTNLLYIVCNNENYALTTGQASPTTPCNVKTSSTPTWNTVLPIDPCTMAKAAGGTFSKQGDSNKLKELVELIKDGIQHDWFAHLDVLQACPSWKRW